MTEEIIRALITIAGGFLNFKAVQCAVRGQQAATKKATAIRGISQSQLLHCGLSQFR